MFLPYMRFECQPGCTACCQRKGFVYLTEDDIARAADSWGMTAAVFEERYIYRTKNLRRLRIPRGGQCRFLRADGCSIHPAKPTQCRIFPFWPELTGKPPRVAPDRGLVSGYRQGRTGADRNGANAGQEMRAAYPSMYP
jgi:uncharacterized protein